MPQNMEKENWRDKIVQQYEEDADVSSSKSFVALLRALDSAHSLGEKAERERATKELGDAIEAAKQGWIQEGEQAMLEKVLKALPPERIIHGYTTNKLDQDYAWNDYRNEAMKVLQALTPTTTTLTPEERKFLRDTDELTPNPLL